jgi:hypothetical protein
VLQAKAALNEPTSETRPVMNEPVIMLSDEDIGRIADEVARQFQQENRRRLEKLMAFIQAWMDDIPSEQDAL